MVNCCPTHSLLNINHFQEEMTASQKNCTSTSWECLQVIIYDFNIFRQISRNFYGQYIVVRNNAIMYKNVLAVYKNGKCIIKSKRIDATITKMMTQCIISIVNAQNKMFMLWQKNMRVIKQTHLELHSFMIPFIYCELFKFAFIKTSSCPNQQLVNNYQSQMYPVVNHIHINSYRKIRTTTYRYLSCM